MDFHPTGKRGERNYELYRITCYAFFLSQNYLLCYIPCFCQLKVNIEQTKG